MPIKFPPPPSHSTVKHLAIGWELAWKEVFDLSAPRIQVRDVGACKSLLAETPPDKLFAILKAYLLLPDKWLRDHAYPLCLLPRNLPAILLKQKDLEARGGKDFGVPVLGEEENV